MEPSLWLRFIDDILVVWPELEDGFSDFLAELNSFHLNLEYTAEKSSTTINFLDLGIYKGTRFQERGVLYLGPSFKTTNRFQYLHYRSCYPRQHLIKGDAIRMLRTSSNPLPYAKSLKKNRRNAAGPWLPERAGGSDFWDLAIWDEAVNAQIQ